MSNHSLKDFIDKLKMNNPNPYDINLNPHNFEDYVSKQMQGIQKSIYSIPHKEEDKPDRIEKFAKRHNGKFIILGIIVGIICAIIAYLALIKPSISLNINLFF